MGETFVVAVVVLDIAIIVIGGGS